MTKLETTAYYEALNASDRLLLIDSKDSKDDIYNKLMSKRNCIGTVHIEMFHNDNSAHSYSLIRVENDLYDLWSKRQKRIDKKSIDKISKYIFDHLPEPAKSPYDKYIAERKSKHRYIVKSFSDETYECELDSRNVTMEQMSDNILGQFMFTDGTLGYHTINHADRSRLEELTKNIHNEKIRLFANTCLKIIPDYVFEIPAGISGKKNSASDLSPGGLLRYIENSVKILLEMVSVDYAKFKFTQHEIDMMIVATMFSDALKHGWQEDYNESHLPRPDHPKLAANFIRSMTNILSPSELNFIANCIESHMGQYASKKVKKPLPMPDTDCKYMVHMANHIASLTNINFINDNTVYVFKSQDVVTLDTFATTTKKELNILQRALGMPIDMNVAHELGIHHTESEINDVWEIIIEAKQASARQMSYIELAKRLTFET